MSGDQSRTLWCLVYGDSAPFKIVAPVNIDVDDLKKLVLEEVKQGDLINVNAKDLTLWKVRHLRGSFQSLKADRTTAQSTRSLRS